MVGKTQQVSLHEGSMELFQHMTTWNNGTAESQRLEILRAPTFVIWNGFPRVILSHRVNPWVMGGTAMPLPSGSSTLSYDPST